MDVNLHERRLEINPFQRQEMIDRIAEPDGIWPSPIWPAMTLDNGLEAGSQGGHGPIRYFVEAYEPGRRVRFAFTAPTGFSGWHELEAMQAGKFTDLRHTLVIRPTGWMRILWPLVYRPLHDALIEDGFDCAAASVGRDPDNPARWSTWVRFLRRARRRRG